MRPIDEQLAPFSGGGILYDAARIRNPDANLFSVDYWTARDAVHEVSGGRGAVSFIRPGEDSTVTDDAWVLRHYRRGGLIASLLRDTYLWTGANRTRCFREWRLLAKLHAYGLPVPAPVAARYARTGLTYSADLITAQLPSARTLAEMIVHEELTEQQWHAIGRTIAIFHRHGVHHADLNAYNILPGEQGTIYVLDFDRGCIRERGSWERRVLARLQRSLRKITALAPNVNFDEQCWAVLIAGYEAEDRKQEN